MIDPSPTGRPAPPIGPLDQSTARPMLDQAAQLSGLGEYREAEALYRRLVGNAHPEVHVAALLGIAESRYRLDDEPTALAAWDQATRAPETSLGWLAWKQLAAARVRAGDLRGAVAAYGQAERRAPAQDRAEIASRLGWLNKELGNAGAAQRYFGRARTDGAAAPVVTWAIVAFTVAIGVVTLFGGPGAQVLFGLLLLDKEAVTDGQLYRLLTVTLVHDPRLILHLAFNMYALYLTGPIVETLYGKVTFVSAYLLTAAAASVASYVFVPGIPAVGASGAIFGLFGMLLVAGRVHRLALTRRARALTSQIGMLIGFNLILGFGLAGAGFPVDNAAHVGGLLAGGWLGFILRPRSETTLASGWQRPATADGRPTVDRGGAQLVLRGAALGLLIAVIAAGLWLGGPPSLG